MAPIPYRVKRTSHPGSSKDDIANEPDWATTHPHRIGYRDRYDRIPGLVHGGDESESEEEAEFLQKAEEEHQELVDEYRRHDLINFREAINKQEV